MLEISKFRFWLVMSVLFCSAMVIGGTATALYIRHLQWQAFEEGPPAVLRLFMRNLSKDLGLDTEQIAKIQPVVAEAQAQLIQLRMDHVPEVEAILTSAMAKVNPELKPAQQARMQELWSKVQKRFLTQASANPHWPADKATKE